MQREEQRSTNDGASGPHLAAPFCLPFVGGSRMWASQSFSHGGYMSNVTRRIATTSNVSKKVNRMFQGRLQTAQERFNERIRRAYDENVASLMTRAWTHCDDLGGRLICLTISAR